MNMSSIEALASTWARIAEEATFPSDYEGTASPGTSSKFGNFWTARPTLFFPIRPTHSRYVPLLKRYSGDTDTFG